MYERGTYKDETEKKSWRSIMKAEYFSSEESGLDDHEGVIIIHPLTWLSPIVQQFKNKLDFEINPFALIDACTRPKQATSFKKSYKKNYRSYKLSEHTAREFPAFWRPVQSSTCSVTRNHAPLN